MLITPWVLRFDWVLDVALDWPQRCHGSPCAEAACARPTLTKLRGGSSARSPATVFVKVGVWWEAPRETNIGMGTDVVGEGVRVGV